MTRKLMDLTRHQYNRWTVLKEAPSRKGKRYWLCKCECGNKREVLMSSLRNDTSKSCGCLRDEIAVLTHTQDLSNMRFDRLVALKILGQNDKKAVNIWDCICDCGEKVEVRTDHLNSGEVKSCGCLKVEQDKKNLLDARYDKYVDGISVPHLQARLSKDNTSGYKGVGRSKREGKWRAYIRIKNKDIHLGYFDNIEDAIKARKEGEVKYHKPYLDK